MFSECETIPSLEVKKDVSLQKDTENYISRLFKQQGAQRIFIRRIRKK